MIDSYYKTYDEIKTDILRFNNDKTVEKLKNFYGTKSFLEILGVSRRELSHSQFFSWLLNPKEDHKLEDFAIKKLLEVITRNLKGNNEYIKVIEKFVLTNSYEIYDIKLETEKSINKESRLDIFIEGKIKYENTNKNIFIIIENKVTSTESNDQTQRYFENFDNNRKTDDIIFYLYLTPITTMELMELEGPECKCKAFTQINYQIMVDYILEPALNQRISDRVKNILNDYISSLSQFSFSIENNNYEEGLIMAIGDEERKLLNMFWESNKQLILASLYAISIDPNQEKDVRDDINITLKTLNGNSKDKGTINISFNNQILFTKQIKSDIGLTTIQLLDDKKLINSENFESLRTDKSSGFQLLKRKEEISETERKYKKYKHESAPELTFKEEEYYVIRSWGINNIGKFISFIEEKFPGVKYEIIYQ
jgi:hypothetical protein